MLKKLRYGLEYILFALPLTVFFGFLSALGSFASFVSSDWIFFVWVLCGFLSIIAGNIFMFWLFFSEKPLRLFWVYVGFISNGIGILIFIIYNSITKHGIGLHINDNINLLYGAVIALYSLSLIIRGRRKHDSYKNSRH